MKKPQWLIIGITIIFSCVIFNSFAQETKFNLFGSKEVFALSPVIDASILGTGVSLFVTDFILEKAIKIRELTKKYKMKLVRKIKRGEFCVVK